MKQDMSTTYGIKKQVTRLMAGSSHIAQGDRPRVRKYASKQKIYSHTGNKIFPPWEQNIPSLGIKRASGSSFPCSSCWYWEA